MKLGRLAAIAVLLVATIGAAFGTPATAGGTWATPSYILNPYAMFGQNPSGGWVALQLDANGRLVLSSATLSVSGTFYPYTLGQNTMTNSVPVAIASNQSPILTVGNVASGAPDSGAPVKTGSVYNATPPSVTNGQRVDDQADSAGNKKVYLATLLAGEDLTNGVMGVTPKFPIASTYSPSVYQSEASGSQVAQANIKNTAGVLASLSASNASAAIRYLWITNATTSPANALASSDASVIYIYAIMASSARDITIPAGKYFSVGISFGFSTSPTSFTAATSADHTLNANYF